MMELKGKKINGTILSSRRELSLEQLGRGSAMLDQSLAKAGNDEQLKRRIDLVRLSHAILTHMRSQKMKRPLIRTSLSLVRWRWNSVTH